MMLFIWPPSVVPSAFPRWLTWVHLESWQKLLINWASVSSMIPQVFVTQVPPSAWQPASVTWAPWSLVGRSCTPPDPAHDPLATR